MTDPLVERVLQLADENLLVRDRSADVEAAIQAVERAAAERGDRSLEAFALARRGLALHGEFLRDRSRGEPPGEMELLRAADDVTASYALRHIAFCDDAAGDTASAERRHEEALELRRRVGWQAGIAAQLAAVAELRARRGDGEGAAELAREARAILVGLGAERALALFGHELDELERA